MFVLADLNEAAKAQFIAFIDANANDGVSRDYDIWWNEFDFDDGLHFELAGRYTKTGNPVTISFGPQDCLGVEIND